jgi:hypothetical protein
MSPSSSGLFTSAVSAGRAEFHGGQAATFYARLRAMPGHPDMMGRASGSGAGSGLGLV